MSDYIAPFLLSNVDLETLPEGVFIVPVCTTRERFMRITNALWQGGFPLDASVSYDHLVDWLEAIPRIRAGCEYDPTENCRAIAPDNPLITWYPESPFNPDTEIPSGYLHHPWTIVSNSIIDQIVLQFGLGYQAGDVLTDFQKIPVGSSWEDILTTQYLNFPRFRLSGLEGKGIVRFHLLSIPQGGRAWILIDDVIHIVPQDNKFVELDMDLSSFPPETQAEDIVEIIVEGSGAHHIDVVFIPALDVDFIPLKFGGGLRAIELCGFEMPIIDPCCPDDARLSRRIINIFNDNRSFILRIMDDGTDPKSFAPDAPENFDSNTGDENPSARSLALCSTVKDYIWSLLQRIVENYAAADQITDIINGIPFINPIIGLIDFGVDIGQGIIQGLVGDEQAVNAVICQMYENLQGEEVTREAFKNSVDPSAFDPLSNEQQIAVLVDISNATVEHYRAFVASLGSHYEAIAGGASADCPCGCDITSVNLVTPLTGVTITQIDATHWRVQVPSPNGDDPARPDARVVTIYDEFLRCIDWIASSQGMSDGGWTDCDAVDGTAPGFPALQAVRITFRNWTDPIDTILTIACVEEE